MSGYLISVIVPIYNKEKYLYDCLNSILNQTLKDIEIILVDDGSTDKSRAICEEYLSDNRVSYYYQENEGLASARQTGIDHAKGEYIGFIDADDWIELDMYEKMYSKAKEYEADVVFCNRMYNNDKYRPSKDIPSGFYDRKRIISDVLPKSLAFIGKYGEKRVISWSNCRRIYRKEMLDSFGFKFDKRFRRSQDLQLTLEAMLHSNSFYHLGDDYLYHARTVPDSLARGYTKNMWPLYVNLIERLYSDTENFKEMDLMPQMHLRAFFFAIECIENEMKPLCPNDRSKKIELINEIMNHPICDRYYGHIPVEKLNPLYQKYYQLIHQKKASEILDFTKRYNKKIKFKNKYIRPVINALTETSVYKIIRHK